MHLDHHHSEVDKKSTGNLKFAFFLNIGFAILEIVGGFWTNSMAIISDALHDLGDSVALGLAWYLQKKSAQGRDKKFSYGYKRFSVLGALLSSTILLIGSVYLIVESIPRLINPEEVNSKGMLLFAIVGVSVNLAAMLRLRKGDSLNEKVISLHLLEDVLGWVAVLIGSIVMIFVDVPILDPIMSLGITVYILFNVFKNLKSSLKIFLQGVPSGIKVEDIEKDITGIDGVLGIHDVHIWTMDGKYTVLTAHIKVEDSTDLNSLKILRRKIRDEMKDHKVSHVTVEFESVDEHCEYDDDEEPGLIH